MRIISGTHRSRKINPPGNLPVRPTTDKAKESLFNILNNWVYFEDLIVLDLFSGTGNISYEFASRACKKITAVDANYNCVDFIKTTAENFKFDIHVIKADALRFIKSTSIKYDLIFADPPYAMKELAQIPDLIFKEDILLDEGIFILEHPREFSFGNHPNFFETRTYSKVNFSFFRK